MSRNGPSAFPDLFAIAQNRVTKATSPAFIVDAFNDNVVPPMNSLLFYKALLEQGIVSSLHVFPQGAHGIALRNNPGSAGRWTDLYEAWMMEMGDDFVAENLTIENTSGRVGQAVALHVEGDRAVVKNCRLLGNQDTLYAATENSHQYYSDCYLEGTTDFIFGEATAVFQHCTIKSLVNSFITAAATTAKQPFGFVFIDCRLIADTAAKRCFLGRPWRPGAKTVFINTDMDSHILPQGWDNWGNADNEKTVYYAEYGTTGAGAHVASRVPWSRQMTAQERKKYTLENIFGSWDPKKIDR